MFKNLSGTVRTLLFIGIAAIVVLAAVLIGSLALRVDVAQARETALAAAGGGAGAYGPGAAGVPARCGGMHALHRNDRKRRKYR